MALTEVLTDVGVTVTQVYAGFASGPSLLVRNATPLGGGPPVTAYLGFTPDISPDTADITLLPGNSVCVPRGAQPLYAVAEQWGLLGVYVTT